jgi:hypothetical protein
MFRTNSLPLKSFLSNFAKKLGYNKTRTRKSKQTKVLGVESLEGRRVFATLAVLDFTGGDVTAAQMNDGGWQGNGSESIADFRSLFTSRRPGLDFNNTGVPRTTGWMGNPVMIRCTATMVMMISSAAVGLTNSMAKMGTMNCEVEQATISSMATTERTTCLDKMAMTGWMEATSGTMPETSYQEV